MVTERQRIAGSDGTIRALRLVELLAGRATGASVTELAEELAENKAFVHRALATLVMTGYVEQDPHNSQYRLTARVLEIASRHHLSIGFSGPAQRIIQEIADESGATIEICRVLGGYSRGVHIALPSHPPSGLMVVADIGEIQTPYAAGSGKLWLAEQSDAFIERYLAETELRRLGPNTITDPDELREEIRRVRRQGYATNRMEDNTGYIAVAVPIRDVAGTFLGSVSLVRPAYGVSDDDLRVLGDHARHASASLAPLLPAWSPRIR